MRPSIWALAGLLYATGVQAAVTMTWQANTEADLTGSNAFNHRDTGCGW